MQLLQLSTKNGSHNTFLNQLTIQICVKYMINLKDNKVWDKVNGLLSVSQYPKKQKPNDLWVMLNGNSGNFCLDYSDSAFNKHLAHQRAWSSDTGYYVKILGNDNVIVTRWWDRYTEELPQAKIRENLPRFYQAITKPEPKIDSGVVAFSKGAFISLRNCIQQKENGHIAIRSFMYLLAALEQNVDSPQKVDRKKWVLEPYDSSWIAAHDWEWLYQSFKQGTNSVTPLVDLVLRHASNKLFQEAHREATRPNVQLSMFGGSKRKYDGQVSESAFYTPTPLVRTIVQESLWALEKAKSLTKRKSLRILDPACGSSEFLRETLRQLKMHDYKGTVKVVGWDISPIACEMSKFVLNYESNTEWAGKVEIIIQQKDSSETDWTKETLFDLVLMNPPFRAFERLDEKKGFVLSQLDGYVTRQPDLAALFLKKAAEVVADEGVLGLVVPHSLLGAETYEKLRMYIKEDLRFDFSLIGRLGSGGLFENALVIPCILVGLKLKSTSAHTVLWTDHQSTSVYTALRELRKYRSEPFPRPMVDSGFSIFEHNSLTNPDYAPNWVVRSYEMYQLAEKLKGLPTVEDIFRVTRGADAGNNAAFILSKEEFEALIPKKERKYFKPCVMNESISQGRLNDNLYIFFPYDDLNINSEDDLVKNVNTYYTKKLKNHKTKLKSREGFIDKWWELNRPRSIHNLPKLVSAHFGKTDLFAFDEEGEYVVGQSFGWLLKREDIDHHYYYCAYLALLRAPFIETLLQMVCNVLEGGYYDMSKRYVNNMPLPDLVNSEPQLVMQLATLGRQIHSGKAVNSEVLNLLAASAYGVDLKIFNAKK